MNVAGTTLVLSSPEHTPTHSSASPSEAGDGAIAMVTSTPIKEQQDSNPDIEVSEDTVLQVTAIVSESTQDGAAELEKEALQLAIVEELKNGRPDLRPVNVNTPRSTHFGAIEMIY